MRLYPAIDLKDGACVRLLRGDMDAATVFNEDPADQAERFVGMGFDWIHVVDLNGAFAGRSVNGDAVRAILDRATARVQLGGGIRTEADAAAWLSDGVARAVLGTAAVSNPDLVARLCERYPGQIAVGIDARNGFVATEGWATASTVSAMDLARRFEDKGVAAIIYTDIDRDGALGGPNLEATATLAQSLSTPVIASGGVSSLEDLRRLKDLGRDGVEGVICGRALYDGRIDPAAARSLLAQPT